MVRVQNYREMEMDKVTLGLKVRDITLERAHQDDLARHTPLCGDSTGRETVAQPVKDHQPFPARQWLAVGG